MFKILKLGKYEKIESLLFGKSSNRVQTIFKQLGYEI
jgi:hypothetical protein